MVDDRVSHLSRRSAYKNKGLRIGEMNSSRKMFSKGPIKPNFVSPPQLEMMSSNFSTQ